MSDQQGSVSTGPEVPVPTTTACGGEGSQGDVVEGEVVEGSCDTLPVVVPTPPTTALATTSCVPTPTPKNGRDARGKFLPKNQMAKGNGGNPHAAQLNILRKAMFDSIKAGDIKAVIASLIKEAKKGSVRHQDLLLTTLGLKINKIEADLTGVNSKLIIGIDMNQL